MPNTPLRVLILVAALVVAACTPSDPVVKAREMIAANRPLEAIAVLRDVVDTPSEKPEAHYLYGMAMVNTGQSGLGQWSLRKAMEDPEWLVPAGLEVLRGSILSGSHDAAVVVADRILEVEPDHMRALLMRARARIDSRRDYEGALADADRALELDPDETEALIARGVALLGLDRVEEAESVIDDMAQRFAEMDLGLKLETHYCTMRAQFAVARGDLEEGEKRLGQCLTLAPDNPQIVGEAVEFFEAQDRPERSLEVLRVALEESPHFTNYRSAYAMKLQKAGRSEEARDVLMEGTLLDAYLPAVNAWGALSDHYVAAGDYAAAASAVDSAVARMGAAGVQPDAQLLFHWADVLIMAERLDEARELARQNPFPVFRNLVEGRVFLEQGRNDEALKKFTEALVLWPENAVARYYTAIAAERAGDIDRAIAEYRYALRAGTTQTDARLRLARLHRAEGDLVLSDAALRAGSEPLGVDQKLEGIRIAAHSGREDQISRRTAGFRKTPRWGRAVAAVAEGMGERRGPEAAARVVLGTPDLDLTQPENAEALRVLVVSLDEMGKAGEVLPTVDAAIDRSPDEPLFHALRGRVIESEGAPAGAVRAAYQSALALDARQVLAIEGLARLALRAGSPRQALELYARAAAADDEATAPVRAAAELLIALGRAEAAEVRLEQLLARDPYDPWGPLQLARLRIERGAESDRTLVLARQAVRFRGGPEAEALLARLEGQGDEPQRAAARAGEEVAP